MGKYKDMYNRSIQDPEGFWMEQAEKVQWFEKPRKALSKDENDLYRWYKGGKINTSYLALDYHIENGRGDQVAVYYDSPVTNTKSSTSFSELRDQVAQFAGVLKDFHVQKGDTVIIYMPMIPEVIVAMLACARIGAIHSVVFGGFAPHELAVRIDDCKPKLIITASYGIEISKMIHYKPMVDEAIHRASHTPSNVILYKRPNINDYMHTGRDYYWQDVVKDAKPVTECEPLDGTDPLYILYTSGTTGKPKGVVRENGGHAVSMKYSMETTYDVKPGDVFWAASDIGWAVGHSYIVYAPLLHGCSTICYEGKPVKTPDAGAFWRVISEYKVNAFFTAPTAFRAIKKEDPEGKLKANYDLSSLKYLFLAGERTDPNTYHWLHDLLKIPVIDHWWQTESGAPMISNPMGIEPHEPKVGSAGVPVPGIDIHILEEDGKDLGPGKEGAVAIKLPLPPGCLPYLWNNLEGFHEAYLNAYPGYYSTGDGGHLDEDGYIYIMGRIDDVINVAGHRLSTGEMEEIIANHPAIAECAVVGIQDELKGQVPIGLVVLKDGAKVEHGDLQSELVQTIREEIGGIAAFKKAMIVKRLPKTRSGKILRKTIRKMADGEEFSIPSTIDDPVILEEIKQVLAEHKAGNAFATA